jgi:hypothetical protein
VCVCVCVCVFTCVYVYVYVYVHVCACVHGGSHFARRAGYDQYCDTREAVVAASLFSSGAMHGPRPSVKNISNSFGVRNNAGPQSSSCEWLDLNGMHCTVAPFPLRAARPTVAPPCVPRADLKIYGLSFSAACQSTMPGLDCSAMRMDVYIGEDCSVGSTLQSLAHGVASSSQQQGFIPATVFSGAAFSNLYYVLGKFVISGVAYAPCQGYGSGWVTRTSVSIMGVYSSNPADKPRHPSLYVGFGQDSYNFGQVSELRSV